MSSTYYTVTLYARCPEFDSWSGHEYKLGSCFFTGPTGPLSIGRKEVGIDLTSKRLSGREKHLKNTFIKGSEHNICKEVRINQSHTRCSVFYLIVSRSQLPVFAGSKLQLNPIYIPQVRISVNQSININNKPVIDDIDIRLGKIHIKHDGLKSLDFIIESIVNRYIPDILKNLIIDSIEEPLKWKVQEILNHTLVNKYSIDNLLNDKVLPQLDEFVTNYNDNKTYADVKYDTTPAALSTSTTPIITTLSSLSDTTTENMPSLSLNDLVANSKDILVNGTRSLADSATGVKNQTEALVKEKVTEAAQVVAAA